MMSLAFDMGFQEVADKCGISSIIKEMMDSTHGN